MLTSEYTVLDGALALAVPTKPGQEFFFEENPDGNSEILWQAYHENNFWLEAKIDYKNWKIKATNIPEAAEFILKVLKTVQEMSPDKFKNKDSYQFKTNLQFPANFGLGSSSTLMNNLAEWAGIDAFKLNEKALGGSGYDIAVAQLKTPLLYRLTQNGREIQQVKFDPEFKDELIFIHLNQKQDSREGIKLYREKQKAESWIDEFSSITEKVLVAENLNEFSELMTLHEQILSSFLNLKTAKEINFPDCPSFVKSLGAWGGDFVMASQFEGFQAYFSERGFFNVFGWNDLINS